MTTIMVSALPLLKRTGHTTYDVSLNPYVGCTIGCAYCYVRRVSYDAKRQWGYFVRARTQSLDGLREELMHIGRHN